jgi:hypothetical protein
VPAIASDLPWPAAIGAERRDVAGRHALLRRICSEFEAMPGLSLTIDQGAKLFGLRPDITERILNRLAAAHVLCQSRDGRFAIRFDES